MLFRVLYLPWSSVYSSCVVVCNKCILLYVMIQHKVKFTMMDPMMTGSVKDVLQESYIFHNLGMNPELKSWIKCKNLRNSRDTRHKLNGRVY